MNDSVLLREATVQEIQLELIRRTKFKEIDTALGVGREDYGLLSIWWD
jgi:hypothetical protein